VTGFVGQHVNNKIRHRREPTPSIDWPAAFTAGGLIFFGEQIRISSSWRVDVSAGREERQAFSLDNREVLE